MTVTQMLMIAGAFVVAGIAKGAIGMGLPPIALALMTFAVPLADALALMTVPAIATNMWQASTAATCAVSCAASRRWRWRRWPP